MMYLTFIAVKIRETTKINNVGFDGISTVPDSPSLAPLSCNQL